MGERDRECSLFNTGTFNRPDLSAVRPAGQLPSVQQRLPVTAAYFSHAVQEESSNAQQKLQLEITQLQTQIAHTQDSLRLLKASPQSDSVAQQVYIARRQMLEAFTCALSHWRARTLMHETLLLWQQWLQQRRALALTVCETRQDIQQRAVQSLEVMARHARIRYASVFLPVCRLRKLLLHTLCFLKPRKLNARRHLRPHPPPFALPMPFCILEQSFDTFVVLESQRD